MSVRKTMIEGRERAESLEDWCKRKRKELEEGRDEEREWIFRNSKKTKSHRKEGEKIELALILKDKGENRRKER